MFFSSRLLIGVALFGRGTTTFVTGFFISLSVTVQFYRIIVSIRFRACKIKLQTPFMSLSVMHGTRPFLSFETNFDFVFFVRTIVVNVFILN